MNAFPRSRTMNGHSDRLIRLSDRAFAKGLLLCPEVTKDGGIGQATFDLDGDTGKATRFMTVVGINRAMHG
jgi:hypothetical protein